MIDFNPTRDWFSDNELRCRHTKILKFDSKARRAYSVMRDRLGRPMPVNSGYRHPTHPIEKGKSAGPGSHSLAVAIDVLIWGDNAYELVRIATDMGVKRIGWKQHGPRASRFVHMDWLGAEGFEHIQYDADRFPVPWIWTYC